MGIMRDEGRERRISWDHGGKALGTAQQRQLSWRQTRDGTENECRSRYMLIQASTVALAVVQYNRRDCLRLQSLLIWLEQAIQTGSPRVPSQICLHTHYYLHVQRPSSPKLVSCGPSAFYHYLVCYASSAMSFHHGQAGDKYLSACL